MSRKIARNRNFNLACIVLKANLCRKNCLQRGKGPEHRRRVLGDYIEGECSVIQCDFHRGRR